MKRLATLAALLLAGAAAAQSTQPPQSKSPPPRTGETRLNLKLNEADLRSLSRDTAPSREASSQRSADGLPGLGDDARRVERERPGVGSAGGGYPADYELDRK